MEKHQIWSSKFWEDFKIRKCDKDTFVIYINYTHIYINIFFKEVNFLNAHLTPTFSEANIGCCL